MEENPIDPDISRWILEFLLQQQIEDRILTSIVDVLPVSEQSFVLPKLFLLRKLRSEVSNGTISETVLDCLDAIFELDRYLGIKDSPESLKTAYCAVAVECSVRCLRNSSNDVKGEYFDIVKRIWRGKVRTMEAGNVGLISKELLEWRNDIESAVWEENVCQKVVEKSKEIDAAEAVRKYLKEEKARMGPSFLELVSETLNSDQYRINDAQHQGFDNDDNPCDKGKSVLIDRRKRNSLAKHNRAAYKRARPVTTGSCRGAKIVDVDDLDAGQESCNDHLLGTPEVEEVQDAPNKDVEPTVDQNLELPVCQNRGKSSEENAKNAQSGEANLGVENMDFEPPGDQKRAKSSGVDDAGNVQSGESNAGKCSEENAMNAQSGEANLGVENMDFESPGDQNRAKSSGVDNAVNVQFGEANAGKCSEENAMNAQSGEANLGAENMDFEPPGDQNRAKSSGVDNAVNVPSGESNAGKANCSGQSNAPKSFMERNETACTFVWDDSIDRDSGEPCDSSGRPHLPIPKERVERRVLPFNIGKEQKVRRPRNRRWSNVEEDTLRAGVEKFGQGYWKIILEAYHDIFVGRSCVDLKDKWRNMTRPG